MRRLSRHAYWGARAALAWLLAIAAFVAFAMFEPGFAGGGNLYSLIQNFAPLALGATGLALVMIAGEFDLSIAATFPLAGLITIKLADHTGFAAGFAIALVVGLVSGLINGWATGRLRIASLAVSVAIMVVGIGVGYVIADNRIVNTSDYQPGLKLTEPILQLLSLQTIVELTVVLFVVVAVKRTWWGLVLYAVGSDGGRARASGLPVTGTVVIAFVFCALFTSLAGGLQGIALATGTPGANNAYLLQTATAVLIGGVALTGGRGSLVGVAGGALLLSIFRNGLGLAGVPSASIELVNGAVLVVVVLSDRPLQRLVRRRAVVLSTRSRRDLPAGATPAEPDRVATTLSS